jgi:hypothetical protein
VSGSELRTGWLRLQVLLVLLVPALAAGDPATGVLALGALALAGAVLLARTPVLPPVTPREPQLRAWIRAGHTFARAEEPDHPGRPRPRAPAGRRAASER